MDISLKSFRKWFLLYSGEYELAVTEQQAMGIMVMVDTCYDLAVLITFLFVQYLYASVNLQRSPWQTTSTRARRAEILPSKRLVCARAAAKIYSPSSAVWVRDLSPFGWKRWNQLGEYLPST